MAQVLLTDPTTGNGWWAHQIGGVFDVSWSWGWPGGCLEASWSMDLPLQAKHPAFSIGNHATIFDSSARVWFGKLAEPERGSPWKFSARGMYTEAEHYLALDGTAPTTSPGTAVNNAMARGLPWTSSAALTGVPSWGVTTLDNVSLNYVSDLLDAYCAAVGYRWGVGARGELIVAQDPTTPTFHLRSGTALMGSADDEYVTDVYPLYVSDYGLTDGVPDESKPIIAQGSPASDAAAIARYRTRREYVLDLTKLGKMTDSDANTQARGRLTLGASRMGYTDGLEVAYGELRSIGDVPVRFEQVPQSGWPAMFRAFQVVDTEGSLRPGLTADVVIGEYRVTAGAATAQVMPVGLAPRTLSDVLAAPDAPVQAVEFTA